VLNLEQADQLQTAYLNALDRRDMRAWMESFSRLKGSYTCIARENEEQQLPLALMLDDCPERLLDRVKYITEVWVGTFEDYHTRHFVQRLSSRGIEGDMLSVTSNFLVAYTTVQGRSEILVTGTYEDVIVIEDGRACFKSKRAVLDTTVTPRYLVYPV
jgi:anthranilate 1,2-dioxygenase small subunit